MTSDQPNSSKPAFQTPKPDELQSEEVRSTVRDRVAQQQGGETDVVDNQNSDQANDRPIDSNESVGRHLPGLSTPPG